MSALYDGVVIHRRFAPRVHRLRYRLFQLLIDLDELPMLDRDLRLFGHNRFALSATTTATMATAWPKPCAARSRRCCRVLG